MITGKQFIEHLYSCTEEQREFGVVKKRIEQLRELGKIGWQEQITLMLVKLQIILTILFGYDRFVPEDFDYDKFDDSRNSARLRKMDHKIRQNSGDRKI